MNKNSSPVKNGFLGPAFLLPFNPHAMAARRFLPLVVILFIVGCSTVHRAVQKSSVKDNTIDKSVTTGNSITQSITTEKADTTIKINADTAALNVFIRNVPNPLGEQFEDLDTIATDQTIESNAVKITIHTKPVYVNGKKTGTLITATAIKKEDSVKVVIDKKTVTNTNAQTQTKNDIIEVKKTNDVNKDIHKSGFNFSGVLVVLGIFFLLLLVILYYLKSKNKSISV